MSPREAVHHDLMPMDADVVPVLTQASGLESSEIVRIEGAKDRADISIFPNPTDGMVFIDLAGVRSYELRTTVLNLLGEVVYESETSSNPFHSINLSEQPAGQYFIKVKIGEETFSEIVTLMK